MESIKLGRIDMELTPRQLMATCLLAIFTGTSSANSIDTPHTFSSGSVASAQQMNENFEAVESAVNTNSANIAEITAKSTNHESRINSLESRTEEISAAGGFKLVTDQGVIAEFISPVDVHTYGAGITVGSLFVPMEGSDAASTPVYLMRSSTGHFYVSPSAELSPPVHPANVTIRYSELNCQGTAFIFSPLRAAMIVRNNGLTYMTDGVLQQTVSRSYREHGKDCQNYIAENFTVGMFLTPNDTAVSGYDPAYASNLRYLESHATRPANAWIEYR